MAKKKATKPAPVAGVERISVLNLKGSPEYRDWLNSVSKGTLIPTSVIVRDALSKWATSKGFPAPPEV